MTDGTYVHDWVTADKAASGGLILSGMSRAEVDSRVAAAVGVDPKALAEAAREAGLQF